MKARHSLTLLPDHILLRNLETLVARDRVTTAELLAHLAEVDERRLYRPAGYPSLFAWCVDVLHFSEDAAAKRIQAARVARAHPEILEMVADGRLHLSGVVLLAPHLTPENAAELLAAAAHATKAAIEQLVAERAPRPDVPTRLEPVASPAMELAAGGAPGRARAPEHAPGHVAVARLAPPARVVPLSPQRFALQVTLSQAARDKLAYAQDLLGHALAPGDVAGVLERALDALIAGLERRRFAVATRTRPRRGAPRGRYVPAAVRREVWSRDGGRCTFVGDAGHRCESRRALEFDHVTPVARGGEASAANLRLRCRAHNQLEAERTFGRGFIDSRRAAARERQAGARAGRTASSTPAGADVIPWLRAMGFRTDEARRAAATCDAIPDAPLEQRVRHALRQLAPRTTTIPAPA